MNYQDELEKQGIETHGMLGEDNVSVLCPFHGDTEPSGEVHISRGTFYCFSCQASASFPKYLAEALGITYREAVERVGDAERADSVLDEIEELFEDAVEEPFRYYQQKWFHDKFPPVIGTPGEEYMRGRKIVREMLRRFDIRWGTEGKWKDRVIIPVYDWNGKLVTWAGRHTGDAQPKTRKPRSGLRTLFGLNMLLKRRPRGLFNRLIIQEGEIDSIWSQQCGYPAVSTMGTAKLTAEQLCLIQKYADTVVFCYDSDEAGRKATARGVHDLREIAPAYSVRLPRGKDPNDLSGDELSRVLCRK